MVSHVSLCGWIVECISFGCWTVQLLSLCWWCSIFVTMFAGWHCIRTDFEWSTRFHYVSLFPYVVRRLALLFFFSSGESCFVLLFLVPYVTGWLKLFWYVVVWLTMFHFVVFFILLLNSDISLWCQYISSFHHVVFSRPCFMMLIFHCVFRRLSLCYWCYISVSLCYFLYVSACCYFLLASFPSFINYCSLSTYLVSNLFHLFCRSTCHSLHRSLCL